MQRDRGLVADGPMRPILVVVSEPNLHLFGRVGKRQEPVLVQALGPEPSVEDLDEGVVGGLAGPREVQSDALGIGPEIQVARDEFRPLADPDRPWIADSLAGPLQGRHHVLGPIAEPCIHYR